MENTLWIDDFPAGSAEQSAVKKSLNKPLCKTLHQLAQCKHHGMSPLCSFRKYVYLNLNVHALKKTKTAHLFSSLGAIIARKGNQIFSLKRSVKIFSLILNCLKTSASAIFFLY